MRTDSTSYTILFKEDYLSIKTTLVVLVATLLLPMLVHLIPATGPIPVGARLLPMFYAPFIAIVFFRLHVGLIAGMLAPVINHLLTGKPAWPIVGLLSTELVIFAIIAFLLIKINPIRWVAAPFAYLGTKIVSAGLLVLLPMWLPGQLPIDFALTSIENGWVGIFVLLLLNIIAGYVQFSHTEVK